jgi:hypothetical protein
MRVVNFPTPGLSKSLGKTGFFGRPEPGNSTKTKLEGGLMGELVAELQPEDIFTSSDWPKRSYRHQLETVNGGDRVSVIEF